MIEPVSIRLEASSHCQLRCPACPTTGGDIDKAIGKGFDSAADFRDSSNGTPSLRHMPNARTTGRAASTRSTLKSTPIASERKVTLTAANGVNLNNVTDEVLEAVVKYRLWAMTCSIGGASASMPYRHLPASRRNFDRVAARNGKKINAWKTQVQVLARFKSRRWQFESSFAMNRARAALQLG